MKKGDEVIRAKKKKEEPHAFQRIKCFIFDDIFFPFFFLFLDICFVLYVCVCVCV